MKQQIRSLAPEDRKQLLNRLKETLGDRNEIQFAYLFGSFAEGLPFHDIDMGVYTSGVKAEEATRYALDLDRVLQRDLKIPADIRVLNFAPLPFLYHVFRGRLLFERNAALRERVVERTIQRYLDLKPMIRRGIREAFAP
jgi:predicted nucleotidyltransferase